MTTFDKREEGFEKRFALDEEARFKAVARRNKKLGLWAAQILGLSGAQAALPIWTAFMKRALAGRPNVPFTAPPGIVSVEIDRDTGHLALPACPRVTTEAFLPGTEPTTWCPLHQFQ